MPKEKPNLFDKWSDAELNLRKAQTAYKAATKNLVDKIIELNGYWPCSEDDPEFITLNSNTCGHVMLELGPDDEPGIRYMPFTIHSLTQFNIDE